MKATPLIFVQTKLFANVVKLFVLSLIVPGGTL